MPKRKYSVLINGIEEDLTLEWLGLFKDMKLSLGHDLIGKLENKKALKKGAEFSHSSGMYMIKLVNRGLVQDFDIRYNGEPVGGSAKDPMGQIRTGIKVIGGLGGLNLVVGCLAVFAKIPALLNLGFGFYNLVVFSIYVLAWVGAKYFNRLSGLLAGLAIFAADSFFAFLLMMQHNPQGIGGPVVVRIILGTPILLAVIAAFKNRKNFLEDGELKYRLK